MMMFPSSVRVFLAAEVTDMRRGFNGLCALVEGQFGHVVTDGHLFVFLNRRGDQCKALFWDRTGLCIVHKRLEMGTFRRVRAAVGSETHVEIDVGELGLMLEGLDLEHATRRKRFRVPQAAE